MVTYLKLIGTTEGVAYQETLLLKEMFLIWSSVKSSSAETFLLLVPRSMLNSYCFSYTVKAKKKTEQKHTSKNFFGFHNHFSLLTMKQTAIIFSKSI